MENEETFSKLEEDQENSSNIGMIVNKIDNIDKSLNNMQAILSSFLQQNASEKEEIEENKKAKKGFDLHEDIKYLIKEIAKIIHRSTITLDSVVVYLSAVDRLQEAAKIIDSFNLCSPQCVDAIYLMELGKDKITYTYFMCLDKALVTPTLENMFSLIDQDYLCGDKKIDLMIKVTLWLQKLKIVNYNNTENELLGKLLFCCKLVHPTLTIFFFN